MMKVNLIRIGDAKGLRIPKSIIEQCGFGKTVRLRVQKGRLTVLSDRPPRYGWAEEFRRNAVATDPLGLGGAKPNAFDGRDWDW